MKHVILITSLLFQVACASPKWVSLNELRPTQMTMGHIAMKTKVKKIEAKEDSGKLEKYLLKKSAPAILGPDQKFYITDRHHTSRAVWESRVKLKKFVVEIVEDWSHLSFSKFYQKMKEHGHLYLYRRGEGPFSPTKLPKHISKVEDDPYRSLSWMVREAGGFKKVEVSYLEFFWADYLRKKIFLRIGDEAELKKVLKRAIQVARSPEASHLPGYIGQNLKE